MKKQRLLFYLIIIDILFLPYIRVLSIKLSMLFLFFWFFTKEGKKRLTGNLFLKLTLIFLVMITSVLLGNIQFSSYLNLKSSLISNLQVITIILFSVLFIEYFKFIKEKYDFKINRVLWLYLFFALIMAMIYWFDGQIYYNIRQIWTLGNESTEFTSYLMERYTHILSEPNNFGALVSGIIAYMIFIEKTKYKYLLLLLGFVLVGSTLSNTGLIIYGVLFLTFIISRMHNAQSKKVFKLSSRHILLVITLIIITLVFYRQLSTMLSKMISYVDYRVSGYYETSNITGSRMGIWKRIIPNINWFNYLILGRGMTIFINGYPVLPHSGHIFMIHSYGLILYFVLMKTFVVKTKNINWFNYFVITFPFVVIFTVNTLVGDLRAMFAFILIMTMAKYNLIEPNINNDGSKYNQLISIE